MRFLRKLPESACFYLLPFALSHFWRWTKQRDECSLNKAMLLAANVMTVSEPSFTNFPLIALDYVYRGHRRSLLGSQSNRIVLGIISLHLLLTTFLASHLNLWFDEAYSFATTNNGLYTTLQWAINFEEQAPFYFILLWFTRHIHDSILIARLPSILATAGALWFSSRISQKLFPTIHRGWVVLALAFNPFLIGIAVEARGYAWAVFLSTLLLWLFIKGYANSLIDPPPNNLVSCTFTLRQNQPWARWAYVIVTVIGLYSHYFLAFQIAAQGVVLLLIAVGSIERRKQAIANLSAYCFDSVIIIVLTLPLVLLIGQQLTALQDNDPIIETPSLVAIIKTALFSTLYRNLVYLLPSNPAGNPGLPWKLSRLLLGMGLIALAWNRRRHLRFNVAFTWLIHGLVMLQLFGAFSLGYDLPNRHFIFLLSFVHFSTLGLISLLPRSRRRLLLSLSLILLLCINAHSFGQIYSPMAKHGDYARVGRYLQQVVAPQQPVMVFNSEVAMTLAHYYPSRENYPSRDSANQALISLPRSFFSNDSVPRYSKYNRYLTSCEQIEKALVLGISKKHQAQAQQKRSKQVDSFQINRSSSEIAPLQAEQETNFHRINLSIGPKVAPQKAHNLAFQELPLLQPEPMNISLDIREGENSLSSLSHKLPESLWLVTDDRTLTPLPSFDKSYQILDKFMEQNYRLLTMHHFHGTLVQQWTRLPEKPTPINESCSSTSH